ncbi:MULTISPECIES: NAD(P)/FAD-dependent oxidoreductase [Rhodococcus]|uniref:FAD-dependent oxidoreductase n=1 Tax=Rhodococcus qingshengii JCM 15477 TaxID=1303681 RepID=A0AB38R6E8_RHOSG|nr:MULTISPECIES: FAD-dependent oxidoreductase [Rhodococcus]MCD2131404.1 FAD-dependent oxidoreductase [Rhodococcus qingshengii]UPU40822.1 FAD-dependent oxidoreductase [Rhodococcus qingshengii JCM 15477]
MPEQVVIIGSGQAGAQAAVSLREHGFTGSVTLIGDEAGLPYQRPPLSKSYLTIDSPDSALALRAASVYERMGITIDDTDPAIRIDRKAAKVLLRSGRRLDFTHVVIATGARVRRLPIEGDDLDGVVQLRTLQDARILRELLRSPRSVVVIGGGFIGTEVAAAAVKNGHGVTIIESTTRLMSRVVSPDVSNFVTSVHQQRGTVVRLNASASAIVGKEGKAIAVKLDNGETIPADVVVSGIGVLPNTELAADAGLAVHNGVLVNAHLRTTDPRISAIGDCAAFPCTHASGQILRLESVQNAVDQARHVAARIAARDESVYSTVPWFWTDQFGMKIQMVGIGADTDRIIRHGSIAEDSFSVLRFSGDGQLRCVESVNRSSDHISARKLLSRGAYIGEFENYPGASLKDLVDRTVVNR